VSLNWQTLQLKLDEREMQCIRLPCIVGRVWTSGATEIIFQRFTGVKELS
jgi:hypothetical protein